ncbi:hypothetical protein BDW68DRAFT_193791 [Aspergillus falconensis]
MSRQGGSGARKLSPQGQHTLIRKYSISIDGPIRRQDWPQRYAPIFGLVRDMERVRYDDYLTKDNAGDDARIVFVGNMCNRVNKIVSRAYALRASLDNEETWRYRTEHLILERFETDPKCYICKDRRWISDFQALPSCPAAASSLQSVRYGRKLCQCFEPKRAKWLKKMLAHHRPDHVVGLGGIAELEHLLAANPSVPATVMEDGMEKQAYFPFLILEAKSEKNSVGFESIERQTVFPIRAMLGLQQRLEAASNVQFDPMRIIDLWHGSILRHDSALQLLLVIDLLCDWARDIFMERILSCLREMAGPDYPGLATRNSVEILSSPLQSERADSSPDLPWAIPEPGSSYEPTHSVSTAPEVVVKPEIEDVAMDEVPEDTSTTEPSSLSQPAQRTPTPSIEPQVWDIVPDQYPEHIAIRSQKDVQLRFRSLSLPESADDLTRMLAAIGGEAEVRQTAAELLELFNPPYPLIIESGLVDRIGRAWGNPESSDAPHDNPLLYACLHWRATIDYFDWQLTKELACITASPVSIAALAKISNFLPAATDLFLRASNTSTVRAPRLIHPLRHLPLPELVQAATKNQFLHLKAFYSSVTANEWTEDCQRAEFSRRLWECRDSQPRAFTGCSKDIYSIAGAESHFGETERDVNILPMLRVPGIAKERNFALLRTVKESKMTPYCVFEFGSRAGAESNVPAIGRAIRSFLGEGSGYFYGTNWPLTALDREYLAALSRVLMKWDPSVNGR